MGIAKRSADATAPRLCGKCGGGPKRCLYRLHVGAVLRRVCQQCHNAAKVATICTVCKRRKFCPYRGRCKNCAGPCAADAAELRSCSRCHRNERCARRGTTWVCIPCRRRLDLANSGKVFANWQANSCELSALSAVHLSRLAPRIDIWLLPCGPCLYLLIRAILWEECGIFAGLLVGPPLEAHPRPGSEGAYALHLKRLRRKSQWPPPGSAAILVCCADARFLAAVLARLPATWRASCGDRLVPFPQTLSKQGLSKQQLKDRALAALHASGTAPRDPRQISSGLGSAAFRQGFYPPCIA